MRTANIIIANRFYHTSDDKMIFADEDVEYADSITYEDLLKELNICSRSEAIRNNKKGRISEGYSEFKAMKQMTALRTGD